MSIFTPIEKQVSELNEKNNQKIALEEIVAMCLSGGCHLVETEAIDDFIHNMQELTSKDYQILGRSLLAQKLKANQGRPIYFWDVNAFRKGDSVGSMYKLSRLAKEPKPIVIIKSITEIPDGDRTKYDDPVLVENILLHSWKEETIHLTHPSFGPFKLNSRDYTVLLPVAPGSLVKLHYSVRGEVAYVKL